MVGRVRLRENYDIPVLLWFFVFVIRSGARVILEIKRSKNCMIGVKGWISSQS